jgi:hypothetical protein
LDFVLPCSKKRYFKFKKTPKYSFHHLNALTHFDLIKTQKSYYIKNQNELQLFKTVFNLLKTEISFKNL